MKSMPYAERYINCAGASTPSAHLKNLPEEFDGFSDSPERWIIEPSEEWHDKRGLPTVRQPHHIQKLHRVVPRIRSKRRRAQMLKNLPFLVMHGVIGNVLQYNPLSIGNTNCVQDVQGLGWRQLAL